MSKENLMNNVENGVKKKLEKLKHTEVSFIT